MQQLIFSKNGVQLAVIGYDYPYFLRGLAGISDAPFEIYSSRGYKQDGQTAEGRTLQARPISFSVLIQGNSSTEIYQNRRKLISLFSLNEEYDVKYKNDYMTVGFNCRVTTPPTFKGDSGIVSAKTAAISLICDDPYLYGALEKKVSSGKFPIEFPIEFNPYLELSTISSTFFIINNIGDAPTPIKAVFEGEAINPKLENLTTGEFIQIKKQIPERSALEITTGYGNKRVEIVDEDGTRTNGFNYITDDTTFFSLQCGESKLKYTGYVDEGINAHVNIYYYDRYIGV